MLRKILSANNYQRSYTSQFTNKLKNLLVNIKLSELFWSFIGSFIGIGAITYLTFSHDVALLAPSFGASAVLIYGACKVPMAQPKNVIGGHVISALTGIIIYQSLGLSWLSITLGVSLAIVFMSITNTAHPPGGATAFIAIYTKQNFIFILKPILIGALILVITGLLTNYFSSNRQYPNI
ncbi:HPP family protein [Selenihalanaerobacter shriftii]|uniref:HPP family protein n=1 Tax=Selenihalanaerobacter shriftii TaxID=142842 RepID=A0A1T4JKV1_9FIRM|nr:HPP family protein [Selenihalanaerobacter shriftii]SJZ30768.1 HPP family protein [Selenihalanaerobacter shriftii]